MELDSNLILLQTELKTLEKKIGALSKIKYKGGNNEKIEEIIDIIKSYSTKACLSSNLNKHNRQQFLVFLIVNSNLENNLLLYAKEFQHLINVIPTLNSCVLANIIVDAGFVRDYCVIMQTLSLSVNKQLLYEMEICLKQCDLTKTLNDTIILLKALIELFQVVEEDTEIIQQISDISIEMLRNLTYCNPDKVQKWKAAQFHEHIGYTLLYVLRVLNGCPLYHDNLSRFVKSCIGVGITLMKTVTLNVFCVWAQAKYEDGTPLQLIVTGEAFLTIEHLQKYKPGEELVQMLSTIAKKPKSLSEKIIEADLPDIISNIDRCDNNQTLWFRALINTNVFENEDAVKCLATWSKLCMPEDISRLLNLCITPQNKALTMKCAAVLSTENLKNVIMKYFWEHKNRWEENVQDELTLFLNKLENNSDLDDNTFKVILLLLLQNCELVLKTMYKKCLDKVANVKNFKALFTAIKSIVEINNFAKVTFFGVVSTDLPNEENFVNYRDLVNMLLELGYITNSSINDIFRICLENVFEDVNGKSLLATLKLFNSIAIKFEEMEGVEICIILLNLLEKYRNRFYQLNLSSCIIQDSLNLLLKFSASNFHIQDQLKELELLSINKYYAEKLYSYSNSKLLQYIYGSETSKDHAECVAKLIKILPVCVKSEWILITNEVMEQFSYDATLKLFNDVLLLISQLKIDNEEDNARIGYCLHQYPIIIKEVLQPKHNTLKEEQILAKQLCTLLKNIPQDIRQKEAVRLTSLLTNDVLKSLKDDREFILLLISIQDSGISQILAQRMLS